MYRRVLSLAIVSLAAAVAAETNPPAQSTSTSQPAFWRFVHPKAKALVGFKADGLSKSPLGKRLSAEMEQYGFKRMASSQGFDFLSDVQQILLSTPGEANGKKTAVSDSAPFVIAMQGKFNLAQMRKSLTEKKSVRTSWRGVELWRPAEKSSEMCVALPGQGVMLIGDTASVRLAIDTKLKADVSLDQLPLFVRAAELAGMYDLWFVSEASLASVTGARAPQSELLNDIDRLEGGISLKDGAKLELSLHANSDEDATKMATALMTIAALAGASAKDKQPDLAELVNKLKVGTHEGSVMLTLHYSQAELDRSIDNLKLAYLPPSMRTVKPAVASTAAQPSSSPAPAPAVVASSATAPKPANFVVRIYNAEGGTREVPLARD